MITDDEVMRLFEQADPARTDDVTTMLGTNGFLATHRTRSTEMTLTQTAPIPTEPASPRRWLLPAAAAAVAIVVGGLVLVAQDDATQPMNDQLPAVTEPVEIESNAAAVDVARGFVEAFAFDAERTISYLTEDAQISVLTQGTDWVEPDRLRELIPLATAMGYKHTINTCEPQASTEAGTTVRCTIDYHYLRSDELGLGPFGESYFDVTVSDGQVTQAKQTCNIDEFSPQVWEPFTAWLKASYAEDPDDLTPQLWEQRTQEYVAVASQ